MPNSRATADTNHAVTRAMTHPEPTTPESKPGDERSRERRAAPPAGAATSYGVGDEIFYAHHGIGIVRKRGSRTVMGGRRDYLTIEVPRTHMTITLPAESLAGPRLRAPARPADARNPLSILAAEPCAIPDNWRGRMKLHEAKLASGQLDAHAEITRDLAHRDSGAKRLSVNERTLYQQARELVCSELMSALSLDEASANAHIDAALKLDQPPASTTSH